MNRLQRFIQTQTAREFTRPIIGAAAYTYNPDFLEMCALMGYRSAWVEMEHTFLNFQQAADLCRMASAWGMLTLLRINDTARQTILKAVECGPDIIDLPMANTPEMLETLVANARFPPAGVRGFFGVSRAVAYGIPAPVAEQQRRLNEELCLMIQIETRQAVERIDELCAVPGIDAIFLGPADLSASLGVPGETGHAKVYAAAEKVIGVARKYGKQVAAGVAVQDFPFWVEQKIDLLYAMNDLTAMKMGAQQGLDAAYAAMRVAR